MNNTDLVRKSLKKRYLKERIFKTVGLLSIVSAILFLLILLTDIFTKAMPAFSQTNISLEVTLDPDVIGVGENPSEQDLMAADFRRVIRNSLADQFPGVTKRKEKRELYSLTSMGAEFQLRDMVIADPALLGQTIQVEFMADDDVDAVIKGAIDRNLPESDRRVKDQKLGWIETLEESGQISEQFNWWFFTSGDSREPEMAGIKGAIKGSLFTLLVTLALSFPVAVAAAIYLEEFAPKNRFIDFIEININNLAAVPSIVFGLLGLAVFINFFSLPRSAPLVGGIVLSLMTLPTIIIASRSAIKAVPPSLREAALGLGASKMQTVFHHVLPAALPGILTGTIIGMAQALGETAPLLMIGMVAFIVDIPQGITDPSTVLPIQVYLWADSPERGFLAKTSAAIMVLLFFLIAMNAIAIYLRKKFEKKW
ncbi:phosphate ABC transporter permease PstA [Marinicella sp. S1101]|uniref:phosphate ABC transporter permease PstA n=1 Tax=Marinicella marina TaxID=2996016 RepID=UPI002260D69F|nr:phosphate ABC transporter permease PstA [Marinicella marina]MCX7553095.1 phosphate ABC transporter permease PstA [Marinicella marina]MDJ1138827.1 phosphate ABC transporter permease PstA [Marinicella marina]